MTYTAIQDVSVSPLGIQVIVEHGYWDYYERQGRNRPSPMRAAAQVKWVRTRLTEQDIFCQHIDADCSDARRHRTETQFSFKVTVQ